MKKEVMAAIAAALAIWFFVMGFELGIFKERRAQAKLAAQTTNPIIATSDFNVQFPTVTPTAPTAPGNNVTVPSTMPTIPGQAR